MVWRANCPPFAKKLLKKSTVVLALAAILFICGCAHKQKVLMPPRVSLAPYNDIGIIRFSSNAPDKLQDYATHHFMQRVQAAQPGTRFLELGRQEHLLHSGAVDRLDGQAVRSIARRFGVNAIITGHLEVSEVKPKVFWNPSAKAAKAEAYFEGALTTKLLDTGNGATLWTRASTARKSIATVKLSQAIPVGVSIEDPEAKYDRLVQQLVNENTLDFCPYYVYREVKK